MLVQNHGEYWTCYAEANGKKFIAEGVSFHDALEGCLELMRGK